MRPQRIQLRRTKGWRKPEGAIVVARPGRWGNPYAVRRVDCSGGMGMCWSVVARGETVIEHIDRPREAAERAVDLFRACLADNEAWAEAARRELAGHDLCCWCPLDQPCHADVLLRVANPERAS